MLSNGLSSESLIFSWQEHNNHRFLISGHVKCRRYNQGVMHYKMPFLFAQRSNLRVTSHPVHVGEDWPTKSTNMH